MKSLQYHFKTKRDLINQLINYVFAKYDLENYAVLFEEKHAVTAKEQLRTAIDFLLRDTRENPFTSRFYFEVFAMAMRDEDTAEAMDGMYETYRRRFTDLIMRMNPCLAEQQAYRRGALIASITEGIMVFTAHGKPLRDDFDELVEEAQARILDIVLAP